jgi:arsenical pump membrane protein
MTELDRLGPVVGFLAAVLALADGCAGEGAFRALGSIVASRARGCSMRLYLSVCMIAAGTTALLSLDTTVVLLTPVVVATVRSVDAPPRPALYATAHLANSASLLLPVSNLTNLLAFAYLDISFARFCAVMALPWLIAVVVDVVAVRQVFRADLAHGVDETSVQPLRLPRFATVVVAVTVVGFAVAQLFGVAPVWVATAGAAVLAGRRLIAGRTTVVEVLRSTSPVFCLGVLALGVVLHVATVHGLGRVARDLLPAGHGLVALLGVAAVSAVVANLLNNLPATLLLIPVAAAGGIAPVLAVLVGVNVGPNLTYIGSLATLLWRRAVADVDGVPTLRDFTAVGVASAPITLALSTVALWVSLKLIGP